MSSKKSPLHHHHNQPLASTQQVVGSGGNGSFTQTNQVIVPPQPQPSTSPDMQAQIQNLKSGAGSAGANASAGLASNTFQLKNMVGMPAQIHAGASSSQAPVTVLNGQYSNGSNSHQHHPPPHQHQPVCQGYVNQVGYFHPAQVQATASVSQSTGQPGSTQHHLRTAATTSNNLPAQFCANLATGGNTGAPIFGHHNQQVSSANAIFQQAGKGNKQILLQPQHINYHQTPGAATNTRMQQFQYQPQMQYGGQMDVANGVPNVGAPFQTAYVNSAGQSIESSYHQQRSTNMGLVASPGTSGSQKVSHQSSILGAQISQKFARSKQVNSSTTGDSTCNEGRSNSLGLGTSPGVFKDVSQMTSWGMPIATSGTQQELQKYQQIWKANTPQRQKLSYSPSTANKDKIIQSPIMNDDYGLQQTTLGGTVVQNDRKQHFIRKRVNTRTPNKKSTGVVLSTPDMNWNIARELMNSVDQILTSDQIKKCNVELPQRIKFEFDSVEAATKVIEHLNNKVVFEQKVAAYQDISQTKLASPNTGPVNTGTSSSSPPQIAPPTTRTETQNGAFMPTATHQQLLQLQNQHALMQQQFMLQQQHQAQQQFNRMQMVNANGGYCMPQDLYNSSAAAAMVGHHQARGMMESHHPNEGSGGPVSPRRDAGGDFFFQGGGNIPAPGDQATQPPQQQQPQYCPCCANGHGLQQQQQQQQEVHSSISSSRPFQPSGESSSQEYNSLMNALNRSPGMVRTIEFPVRCGALGLRSSAGSDQIMRPYNSHNQFHTHFNSQTPNSNQKSSAGLTKSASGSQNASSTSKSNRSQAEPVKVELVKQGKDTRTYLCVKNIPCRYNKKELKEEINRTHKNRYSNLDIITDKKEPKKNTNMGYFFIDFKHPLFVVDFYEEYQDKNWQLYNSDKKVGIYYGRNPKKESQSHKLDAYLQNELKKIVEKYGITTPLEQFQKQPSNTRGSLVDANNPTSTQPQQVNGFGQQQFSIMAPQQFEQASSIQKSMSQVHLPSSGQPGHVQGSSGENFPIAEEEKENEANEMSDEKVKQTNGPNSTSLNATNTSAATGGEKQQTAKN